MQKKIFLITEINLVNFTLFYLLSFFLTVKTYRLSLHISKLSKFIRKRIPVIKAVDYIDWQEFEVLHEEVVNTWEKIFSNFKSWGEVSLKQVNIDISKLIAQEFKFKLKMLMTLEKLSLSSNIYVLDDYYTFFLKKILNKNKYQISWLSTLNIYLQILNIVVENFINTLHTVFSFFDGIIHNQRLKLNIKYIYDGISFRDLSASQEEVTFSWIIDGEKIKKEDVFFLLPKPDFTKKNNAYCPDVTKSFLSCYIKDMNRFASIENIIVAFKELFKQIIITILNPSVKNLLKYKIKINILSWLPFLDYTKPKVYMATSSTLGYDRPVVEYLNSIGTKTLTWFYGSNSSTFREDKKECNFKYIEFCHMLAANFIVWNENFRKLLKDHNQYEYVNFEVLGPLMSADENVMQIKREVIFRKIGLNFERNFKYISIFDVPTISSEFIYTAQDVSPFTPQYNYLFFKDMFRLVNDFKNVILIYKPKRSISSGKFYYLSEFLDILRELQNNKRFVMLDYNINPWIPVALSDMCIAMPFNSPNIAGFHYGKPSLFHDPMNIAWSHRYQTISELITHSYPELKEKVECWLFKGRDIFTLPGIAEYLGRYPRENSSDKFREYLCSLTK